MRVIIVKKRLANCHKETRLVDRQKRDATSPRKESQPLKKSLGEISPQAGVISNKLSNFIKK